MKMMNMFKIKFMYYYNAMIEILKKILLWIYIKIHMILINISIALYSTENDILKADSFDLKEGNKKVQRHRHKNKLLEKFYAGKRDEKYVQDYYEILKKSEKFIRTSTPRQMEVAAYKYGTNYGMKDKDGRKHEHYGFYDENHKYAGKTLNEIFEIETEERRTKDDDFEVIHIFNNIPIEAGLASILDVLEEKGDEEYEVVDIEKKSKQFIFPIKAMRDENANISNKIEQLCEFLHVKRIGLEHLQLEFFIPLKYKTNIIEENSKIFFEITNISGIFVNDEFGETKWFGVTKYIKRINYNNTHEVWKFEGIEMQKLGVY